VYPVRPELRLAVSALLALAACATDGTGHKVAVRVQDESGQPLPGAHVEAYAIHDLVVFGLVQGCSGTDLARGDTGADGTFRFTLREPEVSRTSCSGSSVHVRYRDWPDHDASLHGDWRDVLVRERQPRLDPLTQKDGVTTLLVRLGPARTARGTVRWREHPGCDEAPEVFAYEFFDPGTGAVRARARVGAGGAFALAGLGTGRVKIVANRCGASAAAVFDRTSDEPIELELPAPPSAPRAAPFPPPPAAPWLAPPARPE
jgi:hypothetical protein